LVVLVSAAVVVGVHRLKILIKLRATEFDAERPTFILQQLPQPCTLRLIVP
jgi:hypothetical protein